MNEHFRKLERLYVGAPINALYKPVIAISEKQAEISIDIKPEYLHAAQALHGAIYFKMLDDATIFAANSMVEDFLLVTINFNIHFLRPVSSGKIKAIGKLTSFTKNLFTVEGRLYNDANKEIAFGSGSLMKSKVLLSKEIGYL